MHRPLAQSFRALLGPAAAKPSPLSELGSHEKGPCNSSLHEQAPLPFSRLAPTSTPCCPQTGCQARGPPWGLGSAAPGETKEDRLRAVGETWSPGSHRSAGSLELHGPTGSRTAQSAQHGPAWASGSQLAPGLETWETLQFQDTGLVRSPPRFPSVEV